LIFTLRVIGPVCRLLERKIVATERLKRLFAKRSESSASILRRIERQQEEANEKEKTADGAAGGASDQAAAAMLEERGAAGLQALALVTRAGVAPGALDATVARLVASGLAVRAGDVLVAPRVLANLRDRLLAELTAHHRAEPLSEGVSREELRVRLFGRADPAVFSTIVSDLVADGRVVARDRVALAGHTVSLSPQEARARDAIEAAVRAGGLKPPDAAGIAEAAGAAPAVVDRMVSLLVRQKVLVRLDTLLFHAETLAALKAEVAALKRGSAEPPRVDVASFKDRYGITRKFAIPLLEYLDRERVTRRVGESRIVL